MPVVKFPSPASSPSGGVVRLVDSVGLWSWFYLFVAVQKTARRLQ